MAFWGVILKPGEPYTLHSGACGSRRLRITQASLVDVNNHLINSTLKNVVVCTVGTEEPIVLCTMTPSTGYRSHFNLEFQESQDVVFSLNGRRPIHLAGYFSATKTITTDSCKTHNDIDKTTRDHCSDDNGKQADVEITMREHCSNNDCGQYEHDPRHSSFIADSIIPQNLPPIGARVEEFDNDKRMGDKQLGEELVNSSDASQLQSICTEKKSEVESSELLVESPPVEELVERDLIKNDDKEPHNVDVVIQDENTKGINNVIAAMSENEEIQPTIEINNDIAEMTGNEVIQPDTIEIYNFNAAMTESEEIVPDSEDNSDNDGNASPGNHLKLMKQKIKKSMVEQDKLVVDGIETNMEERSNMNSIECIQKETTLPYDSEGSSRNTIECIQKETTLPYDSEGSNMNTIECIQKVTTLPYDSEILQIEGGEGSTRNHKKSKKKKTNKNNMLDKEFSQNINKERKKIEVVEKIITGSAKSEGKSCTISNHKDDKEEGAKDADVEDGKAKSGVMIGNNSCKSGSCLDKEGTRKLNGGTDDEDNEDVTIKLGVCNIENQTQKEMLANDTNSLMPSMELGHEVTQNLKPTKKKKKRVKSKLVTSGVVACNNIQSEILGCSNDDESNSNGLLSTSIIHDQDHDSFVSSTVFDAGVSLKLKKKIKSRFKKSKMVVDNVRENQNQPVDERNDNICKKYENASFNDNGDDAYVPQEYFTTNHQKDFDLSVPKESKKKMKVKVMACKIQDKSINDDSISQDTVLASTPSDLKSKLHIEGQVANQKKRKRKTSKVYEKSTKTETITVLALSTNLQNLEPVSDSSALKEKGEVKKRKMETVQIPEKITMTGTSFRSIVQALPAKILNSKCLCINANPATIERQSTMKKIKLSSVNVETKNEG